MSPPQMVVEVEAKAGVVAIVCGESAVELLVETSPLRDGHDASGIHEILQMA